MTQPTAEKAQVEVCHYCGQKITLTDCGYDDFWCADPPGGRGTAVCSGRDDDRHWPGPDDEDDVVYPLGKVAPETCERTTP